MPNMTELTKRFYRQPNVVILILMVATLVLGMECVPRLIQMIPSMEATEHSTKIGQSLLTPIFSCTAFLIGFLLSQVYHDFRSAKAIVSIEAGQINNLDRLLLRFGDEASLNIRQLLRSYIESIIKVEWPKLESSEGSEETHMIWRKISQSIFKLEPVTDKQFVLFDAILTKSEEVSESRERRIDCANDRFPVIYWVVIFLCMLTLMGVGAMFLPSARAMLGFAVVPIALGGSITLLMITDRPFRGQTSVKHDALCKVLESLKTRKA
jgi:Protein of unknown function (DUF4239)